MNNEIERSNQSQKILIAAYRCISLKGYANVSLRDIADEAGVVLSQLNYYYKNKEGLFIEVIKMMSRKYLLEVENYLKKGKTAKEKIDLLVRYFHESLNESPELFKLFYDLTSMSLWSNQFGDLLRDLFKDASSLIEKYILNDVSLKGNLKGYSSKAIANMIFGAMIGTSIQCILNLKEKSLLESLNAIQMIFE